MNSKKIIAREFLFLLSSILIVLTLMLIANYKYNLNIKNKRELSNLTKIDNLPKRLAVYEIQYKYAINNTVIKDAYTLFAQSGYDGDINKFKNLIEVNDEAFQDAYKLFVQHVYIKNKNEFAVFIGKKRVNVKRINTITSFPDKKSFIEKIKDENIASEYYDLTYGNFDNTQNKSLFLKSIKEDKIESEKTILKITELEEKIKNYKTSTLFMYSLNSSSLLQNIIFIVFLVLFLIRYVIYGTVWSVKQLKK